MTSHPHPNSLNVQLSERASMSVPPEPQGHAGVANSRFGVSSLPFLRMERKVSLGTVPLGWKLNFAFCASDVPWRLQ